MKPTTRPANVLKAFPQKRKRIKVKRIIVILYPKSIDHRFRQISPANGWPRDTRGTGPNGRPLAETVRGHVCRNGRKLSQIFLEHRRGQLPFLIGILGSAAATACSADRTFPVLFQ